MCGKRCKYVSMAVPMNSDEFAAYEGKPRPVTRFFIICLFLISVVGGGWYYYASGRLQLNNAHIEGRMLIVRSPLPGQIEHVDVRTGQVVEQGTPLLVFKQEALHLAIELARKALAENTSATFGVGRLGVRQELAQVALHAAQEREQAANRYVAEAQAALVESAHQYRVLAELSDTSPEALEDARANEEKATLTLRAAQRAAVHATTERVGEEAKLEGLKVLADKVFVGGDISSLLVAEKQAKRHLQEAELALAASTVKAPFAGVIRSIDVLPETVVETGAPLVGMLAYRPETLWITGYVTREQASSIHIGMPCEITIPTLDYPVEGVVASVARSGIVAHAEGLLVQSSKKNGNLYAELQDNTPPLESGELIFTDGSQALPQHKEAERVSVMIHFVPLLGRNVPQHPSGELLLQQIQALTPGLSVDVVLRLRATLSEEFQNLWNYCKEE